MKKVLIIQKVNHVHSVPIGLTRIDGILLQLIDKQENLKSLHMVSAFLSEAGILLGPQKTDENSNEIKAIAELLEWLDVHGAIMTIDAMGCQKTIAEKIIDKGGDYIFGLKGNQGKLNDDVHTFFEMNGGLNSFQAKNCGHGRAETRTCFVSDDIRWLIERNPGWAKTALNYHDGECAEAQGERELE